MKKSQRARTLVEVMYIVIIVMVGLFITIGLLLLFTFPHAHEEARKANCRRNLQAWGEAMTAYREDNDGYFPFSWQRAGGLEPEGTGAANAAMAATSLGNLYPHYMQTPRIFHCPDSDDQPSFVLNLPEEYRGTPFLITYSYGVEIKTFPGPLPQASNWTLTSNLPVSGSSSVIRDSSYGYDPRISPRAPNRHAVAADWDGSWQMNHDTVTQNHDGGQNVLYVDGHAAWEKRNFCSNDPTDNIFAENNWDADTDSYLVNTDTGLGVSFDGYKHLHYPRKLQP